MRSIDHPSAFISRTSAVIGEFRILAALEINFFFGFFNVYFNMEEVSVHHCEVSAESK